MRRFLIVWAFLAAAILAALSSLPERTRANLLQAPFSTGGTAATFNGTSSFYVSDTLTLAAFHSMSISVWVKWTTFANDDHLMLEYSSNSNSNNGTWVADPDSSGTADFQFASKPSGSTSPSAADFTRPSAGAWHHYVFLFDQTAAGSGQIPDIFVDGVSVSPSRTPSGPTGNLGNFPFYMMSRGGASLFAAGAACQLAMWPGTLLTVGNAASLFGGASPTSIAGGASFFWHLEGLTDSNLGSGAAANMTPTSVGTTPLIPAALSSC